MFRKTIIRLTALYLTIIMAISLAFSLSLYQVSIRELDRGLKNQSDLFMARPRIKSLFSDPSDIIISRELTFNQASDRIVANLIFVNIIILIGGGLLSYYLARRSLQPIEDAHEAQSRFTADASHELRTPLAAMQTEIEVSLMDPKLNLDEAKKQLKSNLEELAKLTYLSEALLKLARLDHGKLEKSSHNLDDVIQMSIATVSKRAKVKNISIKHSKASKTITILAEIQSLQEAIAALLDNAIKYSPKNSSVEIKVYAEQKQAIVNIKDNGPGISKENLGHVFDRFYRGDQSRTKSKTSGYGLGLSIAKNIVELHEGHIKASSRLGKGSSFSIYLPKAH
jgi:signal transduction histidine kinase